MGYSVAVVGVTGMVGQVMLKVLEEMKFPVSKLIPVATQKSVGSKVCFNGSEHTVVSMETAIEAKPDLALFSAGSGPSLEFAPKFAEKGTVVIDNSSAWRMDKDKPLIVPEVNIGSAGASKIIANPNCSTIQLVVALYPLHLKYGLKRVVVSTYQSVTGTGVKAVAQMQAERRGEKGTTVYPHHIDQNCLPHCDVFMENGYTKEEMKLVHESRKIMGIPHLKLTATAVRVPVVGGHSESVNIEFEREFDLKELKKVLSESPGVVVQDEITKNEYPMPLSAEGKNDVFVGRIRRDESQAKTLNMWIVSDNLRKGAATNAIQIAQQLFLKEKQPSL